MGFSSRKWARIISLVASHLYFCITITQVPLFRYPCRIGICQTPIEVTTCELIASEILPEAVVKILLYPKAIMKDWTIPSDDQLLSSFMSNMNKATKTIHLRNLEIVAGSFLCVAGAVLGLIWHGRMSFFGVTLVIWGIYREMFLGKTVVGHSEESHCIYPVMIFVMVIAFCSIRRDVRRLIRNCKPKQIAAERCR